MNSSPIHGSNPPPPPPRTPSPDTPLIVLNDSHDYVRFSTKFGLVTGYKHEKYVDFSIYPHDDQYFWEMYVRQFNPNMNLLSIITCVDFGDEIPILLTKRYEIAAFKVFPNYLETPINLLGRDSIQYSDIFQWGAIKSSLFVPIHIYPNSSSVGVTSSNFINFFLKVFGKTDKGEV